MKNKFLLTSVFGVMLSVFLVAYFWHSGRLSYLVLHRHSIIELNGSPVPGDLLEGPATTLLTIRTTGKEHSYLLLFEGDTDRNGDMGSVRDCASWLAPRVPFLPRTKGYPPWESFSGNTPQSRWPVLDKGRSMEFTLRDLSRIDIRR